MTATAIPPVSKREATTGAGVFAAFAASKFKVAAADKRHAADPFRLRSIARTLSLPEHAVACATSLFLTVCISAAILLVTRCLRHVAFQPLGAALGSVLPGSSTPLLEPLWAMLTASEPMSAVVTHPVFPGILAAVYYWAACLPFAAADLIASPAFLQRHKLQPSAPLDRPDAWAHALGLTLWHHVCFIIPGLLSLYFKRGPWLYHSDGAACFSDCDGATLLPPHAPTLDEVVLHIAACFLVFDVSYYSWHAAHHLSPVLYKHIHSIHHEYRAPFAWVTQHEHALELLVVSGWAVLVPVGLGCHPLTQWAFMLGATQISIEAHAGYDLGYGTLLGWVPMWGGAIHHDDHHRVPRFNFQPFFTYLDRAFGTYLEPGTDGKLK